MRVIYASLAAAGAVGALLIACSSSSSTSVTTTPVADSGAHVDSSVSSSSSSSVCPAPNAAAGIVPWVAPGPIMLGACSATDIANFTTAWNDQSQSFLQLYQAVSAKCQACFFTQQVTGQTDTQWNTIVLAGDIQTEPNDAFVNFGACYDLLYSGGGTGAAACGEGAQDDQFCLDAACPDSCTPDDTTAQTCYTNATNPGQECAAYDQEETVGCGSDDDTLYNDCADPTVSIQTLCGTGALAGDAGTIADSGAD